MKNAKLLLITLSVLLVSACMSPEQIRARERQQAYEKQRDEIIRHQRYEDKCKSFGLTVGTNAFVNCVYQVEINEIQLQALKNQIDPPINLFKVSACFASGRLDCIP
jgi:uncharacterized protein YcfL